MSRLRLVASILVCVVWLALLAVPAARGAWNPGAEIVSASLQKLEIGDAATQFADIADGGRYVAFQTRARNLFSPADPGPEGYVRTGGVFRRDLETGALELVADGDLRFPTDASNSPARVIGARNPAINADGRYVAFTTGQRLVAADANDKLDVYVRDMTVPVGAAGRLRPRLRARWWRRAGDLRQSPRPPNRRRQHAWCLDQRRRGQGRLSHHRLLRPARDGRRSTRTSDRRSCATGRRGRPRW